MRTIYDDLCYSVVVIVIGALAGSYLLTGAGVCWFGVRLNHLRLALRGEPEEPPAHKHEHCCAACIPGPCDAGCNVCPNCANNPEVKRSYFKQENQ